MYQYRHPIRYCDDWFRKFLGWRISSTVLVCYSFYFTLWILSTISILSSYIVRRPALTDYFRSRKTNICSGQNILCEKIIWKKGGGEDTVICLNKIGIHQQLFNVTGKSFILFIVVGYLRKADLFTCLSFQFVWLPW